jgi:hypothetical protein
MNIPKHNLLNKKYGKWTVIQFLGFKNSNAEWLCRCDCGLEKSILAYHLIYGYSTQCIECGHKSKIIHGRIIPSCFWKTVLYNAKKRNIDFQITKEDIIDLYLKQNKKCNLSGLEISFSETESQHLKNNTTASIDRIDNNKGYTKDNIQLIHKDINIMKNVFPEDKFILYCNLISNYKKII